MSEPTIEERAREMGWVPVEEFKGDPTRWSSAEEYVKRGETVLPLIRANSRKLETELRAARAETQRLAELFRASQESIVELQSVHAETLKMNLERQRQELMAGIVQAREEGDVRAELELHDKLAGLPREVEKPVPKKPEPAADASGTALDPAFVAWQKDNTWFGVDQRRTQLANGLAQQLRADPANDSVEGPEFFKLVTKALEEHDARTSGHSKVAGGRPSGGVGGGGGGGSKDYSSLPPEAREACDSRVRKMVGEGKPFKDQASWQAYYAKIYFGKEE